MKGYRKVFLFLTILLVSVFLGAEESGTVAKTVTAISERLTDREYEKAFSYVEFLIKLHKNGSMPDEAADICGKAVELYSQDLLARKKWREIADLGDKLAGAPLAVQERARDPIFRATTELTALEARRRAALAAKDAEEKKAVASVATTAAEHGVPALLSQEVLSDAPRMVAGGTDAAAANFENTAYHEDTSLRETMARRDDVRFVLVVSLFAVAFALVLITVMVFFFASANGARRGLERPGTIGASYDLRRNRSSRRAAASDIEGLCESLSDEEVGFLLAAASSAGRVVDDHTKRRNNSRNVGRLVYAISRNVGYSHEAASVFSVAGMIRDLGLLYVDAAVFDSPKATEEERALIRGHVQDMEPLLLLIDERIRNCLIEGIAFHHENMDGSGYPRGAGGKAIPFLARALRISECYEALVSQRNYHGMKNAQEALDELRGEARRFDPSLLDALAIEV